MDQLKLGDVVTLNAQPDKQMTVGGFAGGKVRCYYFDSSGTVVHTELYSEMLTRMQSKDAVAAIATNNPLQDVGG